MKSRVTEVIYSKSVHKLLKVGAIMKEVINKVKNVRYFNI